MSINKTAGDTVVCEVNLHTDLYGSTFILSLTDYIDETPILIKKINVDTHTESTIIKLTDTAKLEGDYIYELRYRDQLGEIQTWSGEITFDQPVSRIV